MGRGRFVAPLLGAIVALIVACGPSRSSQPARTAPPAQQAEHLRAGTSGDYPPLSLWKDDHAEGFAPALLEAFGHTAKTDVAWTRFKWPELTADLRAGRFDVASDGITVRPERSVIGRFTVPIARGGAVLLVRGPTVPNGTGVEALDRPGFRVAVNAGGHLERVTRSLFHHATITAIPDNGGVRAALASGTADAAMTNTFEAPRWAEGLPGIVRVGPLTKDTTALWVRADRAELAEKLDEWLLEEEASGRLEQLRHRTLGDGGGGPTASPLHALLAATAERLSIMPFVAAAKERLGRAVEDTAQEERVIAAGNETVAKAAAKRQVPAPAAARTEAFFRAQIVAAKDVQQRLKAKASPAPGASFDLETELRPAIARITARMAFLIVRLPRGIARATIVGEVHEALADSGVSEEHLGDLATALEALSESWHLVTPQPFHARLR